MSADIVLTTTRHDPDYSERGPVNSDSSGHQGAWAVRRVQLFQHGSLWDFEMAGATTGIGPGRSLGLAGSRHKGRKSHESSVGYGGVHDDMTGLAGRGVLRKGGRPIP